MQALNKEALAGSRNFWRGKSIRLRPIKQRDLDEILT